MLEELSTRATAIGVAGSARAARQILDQVLAHAPTDESALLRAIEKLYAGEHFAEARTATATLLEHNPDHIDGLHYMAGIMLACGLPEHGLPYVRRAVALEPRLPGPMCTLAELLYAIDQDAPEAMDWLLRVIDIAPDYATAHLVLGWWHCQAGRWAAAEPALLEAARLAPYSDAAELPLALARAGRGRFAESRSAVRELIRTNSKQDQLQRVCRVIERVGLPGELSELYEMALAALGETDLSQPGAAGADPELLAAQGELARRVYESKIAGAAARAKAAELAYAVLAQRPADRNARYVYDRSTESTRRENLQRTRSRQGAGEIARARMLVDQGDTRGPLALYTAQVAAGDLTAARQTVRDRLRADPASSLWLYLASTIAQALGNHTEALDYARRATAAAPAHAHINHRLGLAAKAAGELPLAEQALRRAVQLAPDLVAPLADLALLLGEIERWQDADALLARLTPELPELGTARDQVAQIVRLCVANSEPLRRAVVHRIADEQVASELAQWYRLILSCHPVLHAGNPDWATAEYRGLATQLRRMRDAFTFPAPPRFLEILHRYDELTAIRSR
ncbi:tetratricopeptide repeat protein [Nocardia arthritidis]|uniref:Tetratricopeptide repeat protein n=1 Tax=Nocardia arthritidis TaxID=228602 RepID=A0A6G9YMJ6_9NOCA|nr:tetratricopeptide repeat protein [Nocardia arthritidis]QIS14509.1 hypothetical protein F5544_33365 [Nocardia arthritidis]